ncbi:unnamed protein product [Ostreobium quekettii]|uniref:RRM domain-containing protein n=1 Tax=Ostreobium quekettii TaxID=121088 RepID=A0A8S1INE9_9CHLO|nr:unnamed protein product [Ostreobium quekettii]|eukprot:evm.model.scf_218.6 EVM.evm.TU.scf_218.6   scf_218:41321-48313(+)
MEAIVKVLVCGAVHGQLKALLARVEKVHKTKGPFAALFCVGGFFPRADKTLDGADPEGEVLEFLSQKKRAPIPVFFLGACGHGSQAAVDMLSQADNNITYLGRAGVTKLDSGLSVAFLDGTFSPEHFSATSSHGVEATSGCCRHYTHEDLAVLKKQVSDWEGDIDFLLTCEWPRGITHGVDTSSMPGFDGRMGSEQIAELASIVRPRYHYAGGQSLHFVRAPYVNPDRGAGAHVTRFVSLAPVTTQGQKWLNALQLVPAADMTPDKLHEIPENSTPCPYDALKRSKRSHDDADVNAQSWRWEQNKRPRIAESRLAPGVVKDKRKTVFVGNLPFVCSEQEIRDFFSQVGHVVGVHRTANAEGRINTWAFVQFSTVEAAEKACHDLHLAELNGREVRVDKASQSAQGHKAGESVEGCWFCLSSDASDKDLVASVGRDCYIALDKGPVSDHHVLIIPIEHYPKTVMMPSACYIEMERYLSALKSAFASVGRALIAFERYLTLRKMGGNHCHMSVISIPQSMAERVKQAFLDKGREYHLELTCLPAMEGEKGRESLLDIVGDEEYFAILLPDGSRMVQPLMRDQRLPLTFGREVLAKLLGKPQLADWRKCTMSEEEEKVRAAKFREMFEKYDVVQNE